MGAGVIVFYEITIETAVYFSMREVPYTARLQVGKNVMPLDQYKGSWLQIREAATAYLAYGTHDNIQKHLLL